MTSFKAFHVNKANAAPLAGPPKVGELVAAKFSADNEWYRGKVRSNDRDAKKAEVLFVDYGNSEKVSWSDLRALSQPQFSTQKLKPQAVEAAFSFLQFPGQPDYLAEAVNYVRDHVQDRQLVANVDWKAPEGTLYITLFDVAQSGSALESINSDIIGEGMAMLPKKVKPFEKSATKLLEFLKKKENEAKENRYVS
jgi:staphylococcal nuclease domain-containing protein 1